MTNSPGWAVELTGEPFDLENFRQWLKAPFDPWIENCAVDEGVRPVLWSRSWEKLNEGADVHRDAARIVERLNGVALLVDQDAQAVKPGQIMRFGSDGEREPIMFAVTGHLHITLGKMRMRATGETSGPPQRPHESPMQKWFRDAETDDVRAELFVHLNRTDNWYDLFKSMEFAERLVGSTKAVRKMFGPDGGLRPGHTC